MTSAHRLVDPTHPVRIETSVGEGPWTSEGDYPAMKLAEVASYFISQGRNVRVRQLHLPEGDDVVQEEHAPPLSRPV